MKIIQFMKIKNGDRVLLNGIKPAGYQWPGIVRVTKRYNTVAEVTWKKGRRNKEAAVSYKEISVLPRWLSLFI